MAPKVETISAAEFAKLCGVVPRRVQQWIQEGMPHRMRKTAAVVVPREAIAWRIERAVAEAKKGVGLDEDKEKIRRMRAEADLKEHEVRERRGELVPRSEWEPFVDSLVGGFSAVAMGQLQRYEREIIRVSSAGEARLLTQKIQAALMDGAQQFAEQLEAEAIELELADVKTPATS